MNQISLLQLDRQKRPHACDRGLHGTQDLAARCRVLLDQLHVLILENLSLALRRQMLAEELLQGAELTEKRAGEGRVGNIVRVQREYEKHRNIRVGIPQQPLFLLLLMLWLLRCGGGKVLEQSCKPTNLKVHL